MCCWCNTSLWCLVQGAPSVHAVARQLHQRSQDDEGKPPRSPPGDEERVGHRLRDVFSTAPGRRFALQVSYFLNDGSIQIYPSVHFKGRFGLLSLKGWLWSCVHATQRKGVPSFTHSTGFWLLFWLPVSPKIDYKIALFTHQCIHENLKKKSLFLNVLLCFGF